MGGACCKNAVIELNPDDTPKDPQTKEQKKEDPKDLRNSAKAADWTQMRMLLRRMPYAQINSGATSDEGDVDEKGNTALHFSVSINHLKGVRKLVRYGAEPSRQNAAGQTPLHFALEAGKLKVSTFLFEKGADINVTDKEGRSPFMAVVAAGRRNLAAWAIQNCKQDVDFDSKDKDGNTALHFAAKYGWYDLLGKWIDKLKMPHKVLNLQNKDGETVLGWTLKFLASDLLDQETAADLVNRLLARGALAVLPSFKEKVAPILLAAASNSQAVFDSVSRAGADPLKQTDSLGRTALHYAAAKGADKLCEVLLSMGLQPYQLDKQKNTPLHLAAIRGQEHTGKLLLAKAEDQAKALLTPNKEGYTVYHLALKAGNEEMAQQAALKMLDVLGPQFETHVMLNSKEIKETPLMLAIGSHQEQVVKKLLELKADVNLANYKGELPIARNLASVTPETYDSDAAIFDMLMQAGSAVESSSVDDHPMLAICKNSLSNFAERGVQVLSSKGTLDWNKQDSRGYTPLMLAAYHDNAWLTRYLLEEVKVDPNDESQRTKQGADMVVGSTGMLCCKSPIIQRGTVGGQTPLMCAAKGASLGTLKILLSHGADVDTVDQEGRTALAYAMTMDKPVTLDCAEALLVAGSKTKMPGTSNKEVEILDITGESWAHRAVRYGAAEFLRVWAGHGGCLEILATTPEDADDMPGAEILQKDVHDFIDSVPTLKEPEEEEPDEIIEGEEGGEDSEKDKEEKAPGAVAEGAEGTDMDALVQSLVESGVVETHYAGPSPVEMLRWRRQKGGKWWEEFWVNAKMDLPPSELEEDLGWADQYAYCDVGEDELDEEDLMDFIREQEDRQIANILPRGGAMRAIRTAHAMSAGGVGGGGTGNDRNASLPGSPLAVVNPDTFDPKAGTQRSSSSLRESLSDLAQKVLGRGGSARHHLGSSASGSASPKQAAGPVAEGVVRRSSNLGAELEGVYSPSAVERIPSGGPKRMGSMHSVAMDMDEVVTAAAYRAALDLGVSEEVMEMYGVAPPPELARRNGHGTLRTGPVAEGMEDESSAVFKVDKNGRKVMEVQMTAEEKALQLVTGTPGPVLWANEPYYQPSTRYEGLPKYMNENVWPWWPKVDFSDMLGRGSSADVYADEVRQRLNQDGSVKPSKWYLEDVDGPWNVESRLGQTTAKVEKDLAGPALRERNIKWYNKSISPAEFPLKPGQWKRFLKKAKAAGEAARMRAPCKPGEKVKIRKKTAWFGIPDLPTRPELNQASPLVMAVRLARASCVEVLAELSPSVSQPDGFNCTPLQYALLMLYKERHNKTLQRIVDLLLLQRPMVNSSLIAATYLKPRADKAYEEHEQKIKEYRKNTGQEPPKAMLKKQALLEDEKSRWTGFRAKDEPSIMEPLILAVMLNDMARLAWMVFKCGGNLNDAYVAMPSIPIYFQGLWEKMCTKCQSRVLPLHVGVMQKKYDTVRLLLDMGADPNAIGTEYTGKTSADLLKRVKLFVEKADDAFNAMTVAAKANPYERVWTVPEPSLMDRLIGIKKFIMSIELPGMARPHPWVSPLHLACRFGQAPITFLLLKRGAAANGAGAASCAKKSPLEEALAYARANSQSYNALGVCANYKAFKRAAWLDVSGDSDAKAESEAAMAEQQELLADYVGKLRAKAGKVADAQYEKAKKGDPNAKRPDPELIYQSALATVKFSPSTLAIFTYEKLEKVPVPSMNEICIAKQASEAAGALFDAIMGNPTKIAIKVACFAAKIMIKILQNMMKRPVAHWDPALYAAHVMMYYRAPLHPQEKQTFICLKDMLDNQSYAWLKLDRSVINDPVWTQNAANKVCAMKTNWAMGYKNMDATPEPKMYKKSRAKFESAVDSTFFNNGVEAILPAYSVESLVEHLTGQPYDPEIVHVGMGRLRDGTRKLLNTYIMHQVNTQKEKVINYCLTAATVTGRKREEVLLEFRVRNFKKEAPLAPALKSWGDTLVSKLRAATEGKSGAKGKAAWRAALATERATWPTDSADVEALFAEHAKKCAAAMLPLWYVNEAKAVGTPNLASAKDVVAVITDAFCGYKTDQVTVRSFDGLPESDDNGKTLNVLERLLTDSGDASFEVKPIEFPKRSMQGKKRKVEDLTFADAIKAMVTAFIWVQTDAMKKDQQRRIKALTGIAKGCQSDFVARMENIKEKRVQLIADRSARLKELESPDDDLVINAAMNRVNYVIAAKKLGPKGPQVVDVIEQTLGPIEPNVTAGLIDVAKAMGKTGLQNGTNDLLNRWADLFPAELANEFTREFRTILNKVASQDPPNPFKQQGAAASSAGQGRPVAEGLEDFGQEMSDPDIAVQERRPSLAEQTKLLSEFEAVDENIGGFSAFGGPGGSGRNSKRTSNNVQGGFGDDAGDGYGGGLSARPSRAMGNGSGVASGASRVMGAAATSMFASSANDVAGDQGADAEASGTAGGEEEAEEADDGVASFLKRAKQLVLKKAAAKRKGGKPAAANALKQAQGAAAKLDKTLDSLNDGTSGDLLGLPEGSSPEAFKDSVADLLDGNIEDLQAQADDIANELMDGLEMDNAVDLEGLSAEMDDLQDAFDYIMEIVESA